MSKNPDGIWCRADSTFYYMETGKTPGPNNVTRLRSILISRGLITFNRKDRYGGVPSFTIMTLKDAKERDYKVETVYVNAHVKRVMTAQKDKAEETHPWRK